jgi:hypothetical protein
MKEQVLRAARVDESEALVRQLFDRTFSHFFPSEIAWNIAIRLTVAEKNGIR